MFILTGRNLLIFVLTSGYETRHGAAVCFEGWGSE
jgi:hypothetical protein